MTLVPFAYSVSAYDADADDHDANYCDAPDCPNPCAYVFDGKRMSSVPYPCSVIGAPPEAVRRRLHYCLSHAQKFATTENLSLPT